MTDQSRSWESTSVSAVLAGRSRDDVTTLLGELASLLSEVVPGAQVARTLIRRQITTVRLPLGGHVYLLRRRPDGAFEASRQHEVRGVVIRTDPMDIEPFLAELGSAIDAELRRSERGRDALRAWLDSMSV